MFYFIGVLSCYESSYLIMQNLKGDVFILYKAPDLQLTTCFCDDKVCSIWHYGYDKKNWYA